MRSVPQTSTSSNRTSRNTRSANRPRLQCCPEKFPRKFHLPKFGRKFHGNFHGNLKFSGGPNTASVGAVKHRGHEGNPAAPPSRGCCIMAETRDLSVVSVPSSWTSSTTLTSCTRRGTTSSTPGQQATATFVPDHAECPEFGGQLCSESDARDHGVRSLTPIPELDNDFDVAPGEVRPDGELPESPSYDEVCRWPSTIAERSPCSLPCSWKSPRLTDRRRGQRPRPEAHPIHCLSSVRSVNSENGGWKLDVVQIQSTNQGWTINRTVD